ncbi:HAD family phosphatase [Candidatus Woesearchaeota archaeon]|nr:HAD family phosphatase [Candidatus Woesearchaeota archaeon]
MAEIDRVIFDLGKVLIGGDGRREYLVARGITKDADEYWNLFKTGKCNEAVFWRDTLKGTHLEGSEEKVARDVRSMHEYAPPAEGYDIIWHLQHYRPAILSNHVTEWAWPAIKRLHLHKICRPIIISSEVGMAKPDPAIYQHCLREIGRADAPGLCVFIDDLERNVAAAKEAGMHAIQFSDGEQLSKDLKSLGLEW